ncbi:hypothetical protein EAI_06552 [Harpegnathos saltator]|uniref:SAP domain-containing protein n=1 Tax=Harpegnathos saltator TaxID=610380 RepID=E2BXI6_HARSA|nr:hypothetical protein EAI_06552 [Harpegnathos saltator]
MLSQVLVTAFVATKITSKKYTVAQLRELFRGEDLTTGNKADLILRLREKAPGVLDEACQISDEETHTEEDVP